MRQPQLDNLVRIGQLKTEPAATGEIDGLVRSGTRRLTDAAHEGLSFKNRFDLAYNAGHAPALAALRFRGYRSGSRYLVFQCLQHTIDLPPEQWRVFDQAHRKRNLATASSRATRASPPGPRFHREVLTDFACRVRSRVNRGIPSTQ